LESKRGGGALNKESVKSNPFHEWKLSKLRQAEYHLNRMVELRKNGGVPEPFLFEVEAFFFKLLSAFDCLLQEINSRLNLGLELKDVRLGAIMKRLRDSGMKELLEYLKGKVKEKEFERLRQYYNCVKHWGLIPPLVHITLEERAIAKDSVSIYVVSKEGRMHEEKIEEARKQDAPKQSKPLVSCRLPEDPYEAVKSVVSGKTPQFSDEDVIPCCERSLAYMRELVEGAQRIMSA